MKEKLLDALTTEFLNIIMPNFTRKIIRPSEKLIKNNINPHHFMIMDILGNSGPRSMSFIADLIFVKKQQLTPIINKLVKLGFVTRANDPKDRRIIIITLCNKGRDFVSSQKKELFTITKEKLSALSHDDQSKLYEAAKTVASVLNKL